ncbi:hypothetical protein HDU81_011240 [Chytriomyces hyalinus]|nr:hypothetical protein HDU81_011240 [Chytriomyces hyalinus]
MATVFAPGAESPIATAASILALLQNQMERDPGQTESRRHSHSASAIPTGADVSSTTHSLPEQTVVAYTRQVSDVVQSPFNMVQSPFSNFSIGSPSSKTSATSSAGPAQTKMRNSNINNNNAESEYKLNSSDVHINALKASSRPTTAKRVNILAKVHQTAKTFLESNAIPAVHVPSQPQTPQKVKMAVQSNLSKRSTQKANTTKAQESDSSNAEASYSPSFPAFPAPKAPAKASEASNLTKPRVRMEDLVAGHARHCIGLGEGTLLSHVATSARTNAARRSTFGESNRVQFLAALANTATGPHGIGGGGRRAVVPQVCARNAVGLTQCGSAAVGEGRILAPSCTFGKLDQVLSRAPPAIQSATNAGHVESASLQTALLAQSRSLISSFDGKNMPTKFQDLIEMEPRLPARNLDTKQTPSDNFQTQQPNVQVRNTRFGANTQYTHRTEHVVQPLSTSHFYIKEQDRLQIEPWIDQRQIQKRQQYAEKLQHCVRDKNAGDRVGQMLG